MVGPVRVLSAVLAAAALTLVTAAPAGAGGVGGVYVNEHTVQSAGGGTVSGVCTAVTTLPSSGINTIRVVVKYDVSADSLAWAVGGVCEVRDNGGGPTSRSYGKIAASGPGTYATGAGEVLVPRQIVNPVTCNVPEAIFVDGTEGNPHNLAKCEPIR